MELSMFLMKQTDDYFGKIGSTGLSVKNSFLYFRCEHQTPFHFEGDYATLKTFAQQLLGVDPDEVKQW